MTMMMIGLTKNAKMNVGNNNGGDTMRFFVLVNKRFIVKVDGCNDTASAEHEILDNIKGVQTVLAFDDDNIKGEYFSKWLLKEDIVLVDSPFDLEGIFYKLTSARQYLEACKDDHKALKEIAKDYATRIVDVNKAIDRANEKIKWAEEDIERIKADLNIVEMEVSACHSKIS